MFKLKIGNEDIVIPDNIKVEKHFGQWYEKSTDIDDMSYYIAGYVYHRGKKCRSGLGFIDQSLFIENQEKFKKFHDEYDIAKKILRKQKLKKLCSKSEIK